MTTVYNLESIISEEEMEYFDSLANNLISKDAYLSELEGQVSLSEYFKINIIRLIQLNNEKSKLVLVKALLYTECLIQLASAGKSIPPGFNHICPGGLDKRVIKRFSLVERYGNVFYFLVYPIFYVVNFDDFGSEGIKLMLIKVKACNGFWAKIRSFIMT